MKVAELQELAAALYVSAAEREAWRADRAAVADAYGLDDAARGALEGLDDGALQFFARGLSAKRLHEIEGFLPLTSSTWRRPLRDAFPAFAHTHIPAGPKKHVADAIGFGRFLLDAAALPAIARDVLRFELLPWELNFRVDVEAISLRGSGQAIRILRGRRLGGFRVRAVRFRSPILRVVDGLSNGCRPDGAARGASMGLFLKLPCLARPFEWYLPVWRARGHT